MFGNSSAYRGAVIRWEIGLLLGFFLLGAFSISRSWIVSRAIEASKRAETRVETSSETKLALELLVSRIKDAETGQRGFLLTQDTKYLQAYDLGVSGYKADIDRLWQRLDDLQINGSEVLELRDKINDKYDELLDTIDLAKAGKREEALAIIRSDRGKIIMDDIRTSVSQLSDRLNIALTNASKESLRATDTAKTLNLVGGVISLILFILLFALSWRTVHNHYAERVSRNRRAQELEHAVATRTSELNMAKEELEAFSYSVSHDLRGPLRAVISYASILQEDYGDRLDVDGRDSLDRIKASGRRMSELIDTMLALSRLSRTDVNVETVNLSDVADSILSDLARSGENTNHTYDVTPNIQVQADKKMLQTLLDNLLNNAWKFSSRSQAPHIEIGLEGSTVYIRDNGVGFNEEYANKLFQPFQRLHSDREFEGTGIGLAIVERIVKRHGGKIWATSKEGEGATFYLAFGLNGANAVESNSALVTR